MCRKKAGFWVETTTLSENQDKKGKRQDSGKRIIGRSMPVAFGCKISEMIC